MPSLIVIALLAAVQGAAELLPVSSSAHVILVERWLGLDPTTPAMTLLLVMLHTGTMFAVIFYFWSAWAARLAAPAAERRLFLGQVVVATVATGVVGGGLMIAIEKGLMRGTPHAEVEHLFGNLPLIAAALLAVGILIITSGRRRDDGERPLDTASAAVIGAVQGVCLPLRGFSRSGATISTALARGIGRRTAEEFSFALAVVLTPAVLAREGLRFWKERSLLAPGELGHELLLGGAGLVLACIAGLLALRLLSAWLERGRWSWFGYYCVALSAVVLATHVLVPAP